MKHILGLLMVLLFGINGLYAMETPRKVLVTLNKIYNKTNKNIGLYVTDIAQESTSLIQTTPYTIVRAGKTSTLEYSFFSSDFGEKFVYFQFSKQRDKYLKLKLNVQPREFKVQLLPYSFLKREGWTTYGGPEETLPINPNENVQILVDVIFNGPNLENAELDIYALEGKPVKGLFKSTP